MNTAIIVTGIVALTIIEVSALYLGYDGAILAAVVGAISAVVARKFKMPARGPKGPQCDNPDAPPPGRPEAAT